MIREDRELLTELARLNREMAPLALRMMDGSASAAEQQDYAQRLTEASERLRRRAEETSRFVAAEDVLIEKPLVLPTNTVEPPQHREQHS